MPKTYEITGYITYVHAYSFEVEANSQKEAKRIAEGMVENYEDPTMAEYDSFHMDKPILIS